MPKSPVKYRHHRELPTFKSVTITRETNGAYYVSFNVTKDIEPAFRDVAAAQVVCTLGEDAANLKRVDKPIATIRMTEMSASVSSKKLPDESRS